MTDLLVPGDMIHFLESGLTYSEDLERPDAGRMSVRGEALEITAALLEATSDKYGRSWLQLAGDPAAQTERWGKQMFAFGPWPANVSPIRRGEIEAQLTAEKLKHAASSIADEQARAARYREIDDQYGKMKPSQTLAVYAGDAQR